MAPPRRSNIDEASLTPNDLPRARNPDERAANAVQCRFLGRIFYEGDTVCWNNRTWVCSEAGWQGPGEDC